MNDAQSIQVYLDSSDFSVLSSRTSSDPTITDVRDALYEFAASGKVVFRFSIAHVCEAAPIESNAQDFAEGRIDVLTRLCGLNATRSFDQLMLQEISGRKITPFSNEGEWYPALDEILPPLSISDSCSEMDLAMREQGLNRAVRRAMKRRSYNKRGLKPDAAKIVDKAAPNAIQELLDLFPMPPTSANVINAYFRGKTSRDDAETELHKVFSNPSWVIRWFAQRREVVSSLTDWFRGPGSQLSKEMGPTLKQARQFKIKEQESWGQWLKAIEISHLSDIHMQEELRKASLTREKFQQQQKKDLREQGDVLLLNLYRRLCDRNGITPPADMKLADIRKQCPGLSSTAYTLTHAITQAFGGNPRAPKASDVPDAFHAFYAPYVDIFRADTFMAPAISRANSGHAVTVVAKLKDLPKEIEAKLRDKLSR